MKKFPYVFLVLMLAMLTSAAFAAQSALVGGGEETEGAPAEPDAPRYGLSVLLGGDELDPKYTQKVPGGLTVTYNGLWKHGNTLEAYYTVVSSRGGRISVETDNSKLVDSNDVTIPPTSRTGRYESIFWVFGAQQVADEVYQEGKTTIGYGAYINDEKKDTEDLVAGMPYKIAIRYWVPAEYVLTPVYKLVTGVLNGLPVEFPEASVGP